MKRIALCIGNDDYQIMNKLTCACADAAAVFEKLKLLGFESYLYENVDRSAFVHAVTEFEEMLDDYDAAVFYYAGHGFQIAGQNVLAPVDLNTHAPDNEVKGNAYPLSDLTELLNQHANVQKAIILDACRTELGVRGNIGAGFGPVFALPGSIIAFSTSPGQASKENISSGHGKYTETLLQFMELPRVPIETVFKKTREKLALVTSNQQISWEHTSLIGEFYLNPDTVYDGMVYSEEAMCDALFRFQKGSKIKEIVDGLKIRVWDTQKAAMAEIASIDFTAASANELFILGRNIYQAADGNCFAAQGFIDDFGLKQYILPQAKCHILCGMAYEMYFDSKNQFRFTYKKGKYTDLISLLELQEFYSSRQFIVSKLVKIDTCPIYIPGQNELMNIAVQCKREDDGIHVTDIIYNGRSVLFSSGGSRKPNLEDAIKIRISSVEYIVAEKLLAPKSSVRFDYLRVEVERDTKLFIPIGFSLRYTPMKK